MRAIVLVALLAVAGLFVQAWAQEAIKPPAANEKKLAEASVAIAKEAPKIDGVLDDAIWKDATELKGFKNADGDEPNGKVRVLVARDDKNLYIAVESFEDADRLKKLTAEVKGHDDEGLWDDDSVELFLDPTNHRKAYYHIIFNSKNVSWDGVHSGDDLPTADTSWNPKFESAAKVGEKSWVVELSIPFDQFDRTATSSTDWGFNFLSNRVLADNPERVYWSPTGASAHTPTKFGTLKGMPAWKDRETKKKMDD